MTERAYKPDQIWRLMLIALAVGGSILFAASLRKAALLFLDIYSRGSPSRVPAPIQVLLSLVSHRLGGYALLAGLLVLSAAFSLQQKTTCSIVERFARTHLILLLISAAAILWLMCFPLGIQILRLWAYN